MSTNSKKSTKVNANVKTSNVAIAEKKEENVLTSVDRLNIDALSASLEGVHIKQKSTLSRKGIYKYSEEELIEIEKNKDLTKKIRNVARRKTDAYLSNIALKLKGKDLDGAIAEAKEFIEHYKMRFILNDFSIDSVREHSSLSATETMIYTVALKFASEI